MTIKRSIRSAVYRRDGFECRYCGLITRPAPRIYTDRCTLDHVVPVSLGGRSTIDNLVVACAGCNEYKRDQMLEALGWVLCPVPLRPVWQAAYDLPKTDRLIPPIRSRDRPLPRVAALPPMDPADIW